MKIENIEQWAANRETSIEVATAIAKIATTEEEAQAIWEDPSREDWLSVWEQVTGNGQLDGNDYYWGIDALGNEYRG